MTAILTVDALNARGAFIHGRGCHSKARGGKHKQSGEELHVGSDAFVGVWIPEDVLMSESPRRRTAFIPLVHLAVSLTEGRVPVSRFTVVHVHGVESSNFRPSHEPCWSSKFLFDGLKTHCGVARRRGC